VSATRGTLRRAQRPRLGFLGTGWIGRHRLAAVVEANAGHVVAVADVSADNARDAVAVCGAAVPLATLDQLLGLDLDGIVIATPSALHASQCIAALSRGVSVFCQKPLGRSGAEAAAVVDAAHAADRLLGVDFSYRHVAGMEPVRDLVRSGALGRVYAVDTVFHNAYGPDKPWFYDPARSGGGCVMDLGIHLVDLACWLLDFPRIAQVSAHLFAKGVPLRSRTTEVEDYALAELALAAGGVVRLACSWNLPAGADAVIGLDIYGTEGGASLRNVDGSFYDFVVERHHGTRRERLAGPPDAWGGRAIVAWAQRLARRPRFDPDTRRLVTVAATIDAIYEAHFARAGTVEV
jgi:predicted dehydrogenase